MVDAFWNFDGLFCIISLCCGEVEFSSLCLSMAVSRMFLLCLVIAYEICYFFSLNLSLFHDFTILFECVISFEQFIVSFGVDVILKKIWAIIESYDVNRGKSEQIKAFGGAKKNQKASALPRLARHYKVKSYCLKT